MRRVYFLAALPAILLAGLTAATAWAQDPVKVAPKNYKVEVENAQVRVLRIHYGPHEKSAMHSHPAAVAVFLSDGRTKFTFPDGTSKEQSAKAGEVRWRAAGSHLPENIGDKPFELILVEIKGTAPPEKKAPAKAPAKKKAQ